MLPGGTTNERQTMEDRATQPLGCWKAEFRNITNDPMLPIIIWFLHILDICIRNRDGPVQRLFDPCT